MIAASELAEAINDTVVCERAIAELLRDVVGRGGIEPGLVDVFFHRILTAQRHYEAVLLTIHDDLVRQARTAP